MWIYLLFGFFVGFGVGYFVTRMNKYDGTLVVDTKYEEKNKWFLNVDCDPEEIPKRKMLRFRVYVPD